jgi:phosphoribosylglycinamide formyltransferase-1
MVNKMANISVLVSGGGTNLQALIDNEHSFNGKIRLVVSSNHTAYAITRAENHGIPVKIISKKDFPDIESYSSVLLGALREYDTDLVVCAGFLSVLDETICKAYPNKIINVHPSLLPAFGGKGYYGIKVHEAALARGVKITGATVHYVDKVCDGGEIILQKAVEVQDGDTPEILQKRVMSEAEQVILPAAVRKIIGVTG